MSADKDARIAELERDIHLCNKSNKVCLEELVMIRRKLAEQQAMLEQKYGTQAEALKNILAKAKEEGGRESVPDGWQVVPIEPTDKMIGSAWSTSNFASTHQRYASYKAMLAAAPKPQGETE